MCQNLLRLGCCPARPSNQTQTFIAHQQTPVRTGGVNNVDCLAGKPWVLAFIGMLFKAHHANIVEDLGRPLSMQRVYCPTTWQSVPQISDRVQSSLFVKILQTWTWKQDTQRRAGNKPSTKQQWENRTREQMRNTEAQRRGMKTDEPTKRDGKTLANTHRER